VVKSDTRHCDRSSEKGCKSNAVVLGRCTGKEQNMGHSRRVNSIEQTEERGERDGGGGGKI